MDNLPKESDAMKIKKTDALLTVLQMPMIKYMMRHFYRSPQLADADVGTFRKYVHKHDPFEMEPVTFDSPKSNVRSIAASKQAKVFYAQRNYPHALEKFNEAICWAEGTDSEHLALCYANRSVIYYDVKEYEFCLANIALAKKHNYPRKSLQKLLNRETSCKQKIAKGLSQLALVCPSLAMDDKIRHPKRPFMADGIIQKELPGYGRGFVAERDFKVGEVILQEKAWLATNSAGSKYTNCNHCSVDNFRSLIPCPKCASVMYCSQKCLDEGWKFSHRFECGISDKIHHMSHDKCRYLMGVRTFFYGLTLFKDNVDEMMKFCETNGRTGADPLNLDYTNLDLLEEFKIFHKTKRPIGLSSHDEIMRLYAAVYHAVYCRSPRVRSIIKTDQHKDFMLRTILDYMRMIDFLVIHNRQRFSNHLFTIASVCNHSCDPNVISIIYYGLLKFIVIRPIPAGQQILISYGPLAVRIDSHEVRSRILSKFQFKCICDSCDAVKRRNKENAVSSARPVPEEYIDKVNRVIQDKSASGEVKINTVKDCIQELVASYPGKQYNNLVHNYQNMLEFTYFKGAQDALRSAAHKIVSNN